VPNLVSYGEALPLLGRRRGVLDEELPIGAGKDAGVSIHSGWSYFDFDILQASEKEGIVGWALPPEGLGSFNQFRTESSNYV
jgi:hypothetical protein